MSAAVWRDGAVVWTGAAGHQDAAATIPVTDRTVFRLASLSKVFAATAAAKLAEEGKLDIDAPVQSMVSGLNPKWPEITARQLAAHTSGIPHYQEIDETRGGRRFGSVTESLGVFKDRELLFPPGTDYNYSSYGFTLLSAVVEARAGLPYLDYISTALAPDLDIGADKTDSGDAFASEAFDYEGGSLRPAPPHDYSYSWGGAGLGATSTDVAIFGGRLLAGDLVRPETFEWMIEPATLANGEPAMERDFKVGFGWRTSVDSNGAPIVHHAGVTAGARSVLVLYPSEGLSVSVLSNARWVASIEATASAVSAPFRNHEKMDARACPRKSRTYTGAFSDAAISGAVRFRLVNGICVGALSINGAMSDWFNGFPQDDASELPIIAFDEDGGFSRGALVTPIGVFEIAAEPNGGYFVRFGATRTFRFNLTDR